MYIFLLKVNTNNGDNMNNNYNQKIECSVKDCIHCYNGECCTLKKIYISKDIRNENTMYNTICQSYEEEK